MYSQQWFRTGIVRTNALMNRTIDRIVQNGLIDEAGREYTMIDMVYGKTGDFLNYLWLRFLLTLYFDWSL